MTKTVEEHGPERDATTAFGDVSRVIPARLRASRRRNPTPCRRVRASPEGALYRGTLASLFVNVFGRESKVRARSEQGGTVMEQPSQGSIVCRPHPGSIYDEVVVLCLCLSRAHGAAPRASCASILPPRRSLRPPQPHLPGHLRTC